MQEQEYVGLGLIILGVIAEVLNIPLRGKIKYHGISIPGGIALMLVGAKIAGWL